MRCTNSGHHRQGPAARAWAAAHARRLAPDEPEVHYVSGLVSFSNLDWTAARIHQERVLAPDRPTAGH